MKSQQKKKTDLIVRQAGDSSTIVAFEEHPDQDDKDRADAHELFSMFTASIIKKHRRFVR